MSDEQPADQQDLPERRAVEVDVQRQQPDAAEHDHVGELELHPDRPARIAWAELVVRVAQGTPEHGPYIFLDLSVGVHGAGRRRWGRAAAARLASRGPTSTAARPSRAAGSRSRPLRQPRRCAGARAARRVALEQVDLRRDRAVGRVVGRLRLERVVHRRGQPVEQPERLHADDQLHRADDRQEVVAGAARPRRRLRERARSRAAGMRCASTWSAPSWESSSTTKIADDFQIDEWEIRSTIWPRPRSLSATIAARRARARARDRACGRWSARGS